MEANIEGSGAMPAMELCFELDRRLLSMTEIEALAPGYAFAVKPGSPSPVDVRINGTLLAHGRLVDRGGKIGVEITETL
ncbi:MAG: FliM/FliN family flagellar motor switch protein [Mailhella sp.]|nr:FliM/FliN family flagellar motor switch protein [Mailhella sp.]